MAAATSAVVDVRVSTGGGVSLADGLAAFSGRTIVLFDNGKIRGEFGNSEAAFDVLEKRFVDAGARVLRLTVDLLGHGGLDERSVRELAAEMQVSANGVVLALADAGVSAPSVLLAARLEEIGVPTVVLCQGVGASVVHAMASQLVPGLPAPKLNIWRLSSPEEVAAEAERTWSEIRQGLMDGRPSAGADGGRTQPRRPDLRLLSDRLDARFTGAMEADGYGDGFPLIAPTSDAVTLMVEAMGVAPDDFVWGPIGARREPVLVRDVAAVAVMAGCSERAAEIVVEAFRCMADPRFRLFQAAITAHPSGTLVLVSGPASERAGIAHGYGCLGPGARANATIGRAVALGYSFLLGMRPGAGDIGVQGSPAEYSYCTAENLAASPWPGLHTELAGEDVSTVTVLRCEAGHNILDHTSNEPASILTGIADTASSLGGNNMYSPGAQTVVFLNPEHADIIAAAGWSKRDAQMYLFEHARRPRQDLVGRGITPNWAPWMGDDIPIVEDPSDILIVVVGAPGPQSQVAIPWGYSRGITRTIPEPPVVAGRNE